MLFALQASLHAQPSDEDDLALAFGDKATVSIATGAQQPLRRAPAVATVITAEDIAAMGATDLDAVLESVPGFHVSRSFQVNSPLYVVRGISSDYNPQLLMLENGVPMTTLFVGNRGNAWYGLPVENIARIEVIRGPGSALYGADAYSGVVNIITKTADDIDGTEVGARVGSYDTEDAWVMHGGQWGPMDVAAYLRVGHTDGYDKTIESDKQSSLDALVGTSASLAPGKASYGYDAVDGHLDLSYARWRLRAGYKLRDHAGSGVGVAGALDPDGRVKSERVNVDLTRTGIQWAKDWSSDVQLSYLSYTQQFPNLLRLFPPGTDTTALGGGYFPDGVLGAPNTWERQLRASVATTYTGFDDHTVRIGLGHDDLDLYRTQEFRNYTLGAGGVPIPLAGGVVESSDADTFLTPHRRLVDYAYVQDEWRVAQDWTLTGGIRRDHYSDFGDTTNPRLALVWDASLDWTAKLLYGQAFRAPAFVEKYSINNPVNRGNPELQPETIDTLETAFAWQARQDLDLNLSLYRYRMKDIIRATSQSDGTVLFTNSGTQHGHGLELEATWRLSPAVRVQGYYAWSMGKDEGSDTDAAYVPSQHVYGQHVYGRVDWNVASGWAMGGQLNYVAGRKREAGDTRPDVADYTTVDLNVRANTGRSGWEFSGGIRNLFNADAREPSRLSNGLPNDLPLPGRTLFVQAVYRL
jgi:iron complex outermembrane receptor protein